MNDSLLRYNTDCTYIVGVSGEDSLPLVEISNGWVQGTHQTSYNGRVYSSFQGIPYAQPPVGELRFEVIKRNSIVLLNVCTTDINKLL